MRALFIFAICAAFWVAVWGAAIIPHQFANMLPGDNLGGGYPTSLRLVGAIEDKIYFADNSITLNWTEAETYCDSFGMELATITSLNQTEFLNRSHSQHFSGSFWTAGRDALQLRQFSWDSEGTWLEARHNLQLVSKWAGPLTCVLHHTVSPTDSHLDSDTCAFKRGVLCQAFL